MAIALEPARLFANPYGAFRAEDKAFVIEDIHTPRPWANVLSNDRYGLTVTQYGGGFSWLNNCQTCRLTRWEQDLARDDMGRFVYVADLDEKQVWSTTYQPTRQRGTVDRVVHGLGWSRFEREVHGIRTDHTMFIPMDQDAEVWILRIENRSMRTRKIRLASYVEWHLGDIGDWHREFHRLFMESKVVDGALVAWKHPKLIENDRSELEEPVRAAMRWNGAAVRWRTDKLSWLGRGGGTDRPLGIFDVPPASETPRWDDPVGVGIVDLELDPMDVVELVIVLGAAQGESAAVATVAPMDAAQAREKLEQTKRYWLDRTAAMAVETGDAATDFMANSWLPYQAIAGRIYARCAIYQQGGAYGHRDQLQDSLMFLRSEPENCLLQLKRHAGAQFADGSVMHWWHPGGFGVESHHSDTCLWGAYGLSEYVRVTNDRTALDAEVDYLPGKAAFVPFPESARGGGRSLLDHALRGIRRALDRRSPRGLPLIGAGDWNDGLSHAGIDGKGESVWLAMFLFDILNRWSPVLEDLGEGSLAERFRREAASLKEAVNAHGWDGEWYVAGFRDDGKPFGSRTNEEGRIFLNPQTWAVITGIAPADRAALALKSAREHLVKPYGAVLLLPAYKKVDPYIGYITRYAPALRENGGVYSHASTWAVQAFAMLGDLDTAWKVFRGMLPSLRSAEDADRYAAEPYVMPGNSDGPDSPFEGRAGWTWYTGSAAWMVRIAATWLTPR